MNFYKLEMMKIRMTTYLRAIGAITISILGIGILFLFMLSIPAQMGVEATEVELFANWNGLLTLVTALSFAFFGVLAGVMAGKIIIEEYYGKGAVILLSYPVNRKRIVRIKCLITCGIIVISAFLCNLLVMGVAFVTARIFTLMLEAPRGYFVVTVLVTSVLTGLISASVGMISALIGWKMRSVTATTISSVIIVCMLTNAFVAVPAWIVWIVIGISAVVMIIANILYHILAGDINKMEV